MAQPVITNDGIARTLSAEAGTLVTNDPGAYELAIEPWELLCSPMDRGAFHHSLTFLKTPQFVLYRETYDLGVTLQGLSPPGMLAISVPLTFGSRTAYWRQPVLHQSMPSTLPGPLDVRLDTGHSHLIALVPLEMVQRRIPEELIPALLRIAEHRQRRLPPRIVHGFAAWMKRLLAVAERHPERLTAEAALATIDQELSTLLMGIAEASRPRGTRPPAPAKSRCLKRVLEYLRGTEVAKITIPTLCRATGVSERTLQYAFREIFHTTPLAYLKRRRFHAARRQLLASNAAAATVSEVAVAQGFYELGRFAVEYRQMFGEPPSETLHRPPLTPACSLRSARGSLR